VSWLGVKYALACRDARVKGGTRLVLVALGVRVEYQRITTSPTSLGDLQWLTFMSAEQIRRTLDNLETWGTVRRLRRGKNATYALPEMAGPLFAVNDGDPVKMTDFVIEHLPGEIGQNARKVTGKMPGFRRKMTDFSGRRAGGVLFSEVRSTEVPTTAGDHEQPAVAAFLAWWAYAFPLYHDGALPNIDPDADGRLVAELLAHRPAYQLQNMAACLWSMDAREDAWVANSDKSLRVLKHRADRLDLRLNRLPNWWLACTHTPKCARMQDCGREEALA